MCVCVCVCVCVRVCVCLFSNTQTNLFDVSAVKQIRGTLLWRVQNSKGWYPCHVNMTLHHEGGCCLTVPWRCAPWTRLQWKRTQIESAPGALDPPLPHRAHSGAVDTPCPLVGPRWVCPAPPHQMPHLDEGDVVAAAAAASVVVVQDEELDPDLPQVGRRVVEVVVPDSDCHSLGNSAKRSDLDPRLRSWAPRNLGPEIPNLKHFACRARLGG